MQSRSAKAVASCSQKQKEWCPGITLIELVFIMMIVVTLGAIGFPAYNKYRDNARMVQAVADIRTIEHDIYIYEGYNAKLPDFLDEIGKSNLRDPWGNPYQYLNATTKKGAAKQRFDKLFKPLNTDLDLYSMGKDGKTEPNLDKKESLDDIVRAVNGAYVGLASEY
jgi:general secretion pathway protein G